jgi:hypothetical protein
MAKKITCTMYEVQEGDNGGCLACGEITYGGVEPDARKFECESCGAKQLYGLEELIVMGMIELSDEE